MSEPIDAMPPLSSTPAPSTPAPPAVSGESSAEQLAPPASSPSSGTGSPQQNLFAEDLPPVASDVGCDPAEIRRNLHAKFDAWLDRMLADETPPEGLPPELLEQADTDGARDCDLYALFSALTGLTGEIRLQGRSFKQLTDALAAVRELPARFDGIEAAQAQVASALQKLTDQTAEDAGPSLPGARQTLEVIFDLHDRLRRLGVLVSEFAALAGRKPRFSIVIGGKSAQALKKSAGNVGESCRLTLSRIEAALHQWGIEPVGRIGDSFAPERMNAIDVETSRTHEDGTVLEVYRTGFEAYGQILSPAQVKVARRSAPGN